MPDHLTGKAKQLVIQPAKIVIEQGTDGQFKLSHNIIKPSYLIGILTTTLNNVVNAFIQQEQMVIDPNRPRNLIIKTESGTTIGTEVPAESEPTPEKAN